MDLYKENCDLEKQIRKKHKKMDNESRGRGDIITARQNVEYSLGKVNNENYFEWQKKYNSELRSKLSD
jgi:hypothetical protein